MADVWIYVAPDKFREMELVRAESLVRIRQLKGDYAPPVLAYGPDWEVTVADAVTVIGEPLLPADFGLRLVGTLQYARAQAKLDGHDRVVTARLGPDGAWSWETHLLDAAPASWRSPAGS